MFKRGFPIHVEFEALDRLIDYLIERDGTQEKLDELSAQVMELTEALNQSTAGLDTAVAAEEKS